MEKVCYAHLENLYTGLEIKAKHAKGDFFRTPGAVNLAEEECYRILVAAFGSAKL